MTRLLQDLLNGLSSGSVYALLAVGIVLVYKSSEILNFAHGTFAMLSTYVAYHVSVALGLGGHGGGGAYRHGLSAPLLDGE